MSEHKEEQQQLTQVKNRMERLGIDEPHTISTAQVVHKLRKCSQWLNQLHEKECYVPGYERAEEGQTPKRFEVLEARREKEAQELARMIGASVYFQGDCRGAAIYLLFSGDIPRGGKVDQHYNNGIAIF